MLLFLGIIIGFMVGSFGMVKYYNSYFEKNKETIVWKGRVYVLFSEFDTDDNNSSESI